ncbi:hypothetical protein TOPH_04592 [Tolypocladium ophioglossoides CBS 100239]|uniref:Uncharacterized protein n=1 Tax=Tolypocladium ophioglossoides (strain CBS 100239) TaxID=1163406 RepID=A0A0L0N978_TOLOC|nr:hypothetical protein TOPH_04592 [Tolypocladium ophioglossoides CBS 100239]
MASAFHASLGRSTTVALIVLPIAIPVAYLVCLNRAIRKSTTSIARRRDQPPSLSPESSHQPRDPASLPADVKSDSSQWVVAYERVVSNPISTSSLAFAVAEPSTLSHSSPDGSSTTQPSTLLREYIRAAQVAFSWTPQAVLIRAMIKEADIRRSFDGAWIDGLTFAPGELVNGVYRVSHHQNESSTMSERAELIMEVPASFKGPSVRGLLVAAIEPAPAADSQRSNSQRADETDEGGKVVFVNETWMWRRTEEKPTLLETPFGKWFHTQLAGWLIMKGISAVVGVGKQKTH